MEEAWIVDRAKLQALLAAHPALSLGQLVEATGRSRGWVKKWKSRFQEGEANNEQVLRSQSRRRKHLPEPYDTRVVYKILSLRDTLPSALKRVAGAKTILYYLHQDMEMQQAGLRLPTSPTTIWRILDRHQRIYRRPQVEHEPVDRPAPMEEWEIDFCDVTSVTPQEEGKKQHVVEVFNVVDRGTSILVDTVPRGDYNEETALMSLHQVFETYGLPRRIRMDRDPRFVGSWGIDGFPSALIRYLLCLSVDVDICPPHKPHLKPFVERFNRTQQHECFLVERPTDLEQTISLSQRFRTFYNEARPHQGLSCRNRPPRVAFPHLPTLPALPERVDPDRWVKAFHNRMFKRRVSGRGTVDVDDRSYYISKNLAGRYVVLKLNAPGRYFDVDLGGQLVKRLALKGLMNGEMPYDEYLFEMGKQARSDIRRLQQRQKLRRAALS